MASKSNPQYRTRIAGALSELSPLHFVLGGLTVLITITLLDLLAVTPGRPLLISVVSLAVGVAAPFAMALMIIETHGSERHLWSSLFFAYTGFMLGMGFWALQTIMDPGVALASSVADVPALLAYVAVVPATLLITDPAPKTRLRRLRDVADLTLLLLVAGLIAAAFEAHGHSGGAQSDKLENILPVIYVALDVALMMYFLGFRRITWDKVTGLLAASFLVVTASDLTMTVVSYVSTRGMAAYSPFTIIASWGFSAFFGIAAAAVRLHEGRLGVTEARRARKTVADWMGLIAPIGMVIATPLFLYTAKGWPSEHEATFDVFVAVAVAVLVLVVVRTILTAIDVQRLVRETITDPLTGLYTHRYFHEQVDRELTALPPAGTALLMIDIDHFAQFNRAHGHREADQHLIRVAGILSGFARACDTVVHMGGDEFAMILPGMDALQAVEITAQLERELRHGSGTPSTFSAGVVVAPANGTTFDILERNLTGAVYWAKLTGRSRTVVYDPETVTAVNAEQSLSMMREQSYETMIELLAGAVDARDSYTQDHSRSVAELAERFALYLGLEPEHRNAVRTAATLHDVGKIGVPDSILRKNSALDDAERAIVETHSDLGASILKSAPMPEIVAWVRGHHERWDGRGYPDGLAGDAIPFEARLIAICDAFDAMTSDRTYRKAMHKETALAEIARCAGRQFDPDLAEAFVTCMIEVVAEPVTDTVARVPRLRRLDLAPLDMEA